MILATERCIVRDFIEEDWFQLHQYCSDTEVTRYTFWGPNTEEQTRDFIDSSIKSQIELPRKSYEMAIVDKRSNAILGNCCIRVEKTNAEIGYCLSQPYWGKGLATEVTRTLMQFGFQELGIHRIYATCRPENIGSAKVMEKAGMRKEGHLREHTFFKNEWQDSYMYSILKHEFLCPNEGADADGI